jgi:hypothetical protein
MINIRHLSFALLLGLFQAPAFAQDLSEKIAAVKLGMAAYGFTYSDIRYCEISKGNQCYFNRNFYGGVTYVIMAVGADGLYDLDLFVYNSNGTRYSEDVTKGEYPAISFYQPYTGNLSIYAKNVHSYNSIYKYPIAILIGVR